MNPRPPRRLIDPSTHGLLVLRRSWPHGPGCLQLEFGAARAGGGVVAGQWFADPAALAAAAAATPPPATVVPGSGVLLQPGGADRRLRGLAGLAARADTTLIVHRPERRAVLRRGEGSYVKVVRPGRGGPLVAAVDRVSAAAGETFAVPRLLQRDDRLGILEWSTLPGRTLHELGADPTVPDRAFAAAWRAAGRAVAALHDGPAGPDAPRHDAAAEVTTTRRWLAAAAELGLLPAVDVDRLLEELVMEPPGPPGLLHRDLHDKQVLVHPRGGPPGVLDVDTCAVGERALDLANVLVHLEWRRTQGVLSAARAVIAREELLAGLDPDPRTLARVPAYARATQLRLAGVYAFRPRWLAAARALLALPAGR